MRDVVIIGVDVAGQDVLCGLPGAEAQGGKLDDTPVEALHHPVGLGVGTGSAKRRCELTEEWRQSLHGSKSDGNSCCAYYFQSARVRVAGV